MGGFGTGSECEALTPSASSHPLSPYSRTRGGEAASSGMVAALALAQVCDTTTVYGVGRARPYQYFAQKFGKVRLGRNGANTDRFEEGWVKGLRFRIQDLKSHLT